MFTKDESLREVEKLVAKYKGFGSDVDRLKEEETKKDFILPLFKALNWDTENSKEVSAEEKISKKRVDYGFRINGIPKFFCEAKAAGEVLGEDYAKQSVNYSWLKTTTWAVLTNFVRLDIYNAEWESKNVFAKRFISIGFEEYVSKFDQLWLLSRNSFEASELDKVAEDWGKKQKKVPITPVTDRLFVDMIGWRQGLTKSIASKKANMEIVRTEDVLDECVQRILDRMIFIRVCEDRQLEPNTLLSRLREWKGAGRDKSFYKLLVDVFGEFDRLYDSKLFAHHTADDLDIDDIVLSFMINELYENKHVGFGYDFSAIDADVLGSIYEQYLGYILEKHRKKTEVIKDNWKRKSLGIFYTPAYVVDYVVRNTVEKVPLGRGSSALKILDPACGSGSFLSRALGSLVQDGDGFLSEMHVLLDSIHGVDLDPKAVEIAQLDLMLKILEKRQALPYLDRNLREGNSLITDSNVDSRSFDWAHEFHEIIAKGGFDIVIGNPPYVESRDIPDKEWDYYRNHYESAYKRFDLSVLFVEKGVQLLKDGGLLGFIISNKFAASDYGFGVRKYILENCAIEQIIDVSNIDVFRDASTYPYIIILRKEDSEKARKSQIIKAMKVSNKDELQNSKLIYEIHQSAFYESPNLIFSIDLTPSVKKLIDRMSEKSVPLGDICEMKDGIHTGNVKEKLIVNSKVDSSSKRLITAESIDRYVVGWGGLWVRYDPDLIDSSKGEYGSLRDERIFTAREKLMTALFGLRLEVAFDENQLYANNSVKIILPLEKGVNLKYLLACLNSKLLAFYHRTFYAPTHVRGGYMQFYPQDILQLPIKQASASDIGSIVSLVDRILQLNKDLAEVPPSSDKGKKLQNEVAECDGAIDQMVYRIYGLSEDEIATVERASNFD